MKSSRIKIAKIAFVIASIHAVVGFLWIAYSDAFVLKMIDDVNVLTLIQTYKGWGYVFVTAILLYFLIYTLFKRHSDQLQKKQQEVEKSRQLFKTVLQQIPDAIYVKDLTGRYIYLNGATANLLGCSAKELLHKTDEQIPVFDNKQVKELMQIDKKVISSDTLDRRQEKLTVANGKEKLFETTKGALKTESGELFGLFGVTRDITKAKEYEKSLIQAKETFFNLAHYDTLTKLPNRVYLIDKLYQKVKRREGFALLLLDLDGFKVINDSYGHSFGDKLIYKISQLIAEIDQNCFVARMGGDEFAVIIDGAKEPECTHYIQKLYKYLNKAFTIDGVEIFITVSIGISICDGDEKNHEIVLQEADSAISNAKNIGKNTFSFFSSSFTEAAMFHTQIVTNLKKAIEGSQLTLYFQAQNDAKSGKVTGAEALIRWHDGSEYISPAIFIPIAEESGMIVELGKFVMQKGFAFAVQANKLGLLEDKVAINLSARELSHINFLHTLEAAIQNTRCDPSLIELEITESCILENPKQTIEILKVLRDRGFSIAIDDFGTGYSSLSYLKTLPVDKLKIDQSFIKNIVNEPKNQTIVKTIISLAKGLGITVLAEGVETKQELEFLITHKIDFVQGYLFSKPKPQEAFVKGVIDTKQTPPPSP